MYILYEEHEAFEAYFCTKKVLTVNEHIIIYKYIKNIKL